MDYITWHTLFLNPLLLTSKNQINVNLNRYDTNNLINFIILNRLKMNTKSTNKKYVSIKYQTSEHKLEINTSESKNTIPLVIYNKNFNQKFYVIYNELIKVLNNVNRAYAFNTIILCKTPDAEYKTLIKKIQHDYVTDKIIHMELYLLNKDSKEKVTVPVPIELINLKQHKLSIELNKPIIQILKHIDLVIHHDKPIPREITIDMSCSLKKYRIMHLLSEHEELQTISKINMLYTIAKIK